MFSIFPTISILDTLDKSGKDAYSNSSMVQALSRVPDALFDKSPPPVLSPIVPRAPTVVKTASLSKPVGPLARSSSRASHKSKSDPKPDSGIKKGKAGKLGKAAIVSKSRSSSSRAGLIFPVGRLKRRLKETIPGIRVSKNTSVYLAAIL